MNAAVKLLDNLIYEKGGQTFDLIESGSLSLPQEIWYLSGSF